MGPKTKFLAKIALYKILTYRPKQPLIVIRPIKIV